MDGDRRNQRTPFRITRAINRADVPTLVIAVMGIVLLGGPLVLQALSLRSLPNEGTASPSAAEANPVSAEATEDRAYHEQVMGIISSATSDIERFYYASDSESARDGFAEALRVLSLVESVDPPDWHEDSGRDLVLAVERYRRAAADLYQTAFFISGVGLSLDEAEAAFSKAETRVMQVMDRQSAEDEELGFPTYTGDGVRPQEVRSSVAPSQTTWPELQAVTIGDVIYLVAEENDGVVSGNHLDGTLSATFVVHNSPYQDRPYYALPSISVHMPEGVIVRPGDTVALRVDRPDVTQSIMMDCTLIDVWPSATPVTVSVPHNVERGSSEWRALLAAVEERNALGDVKFSLVAAAMEGEKATALVVPAKRPDMKYFTNFWVEDGKWVVGDVIWIDGDVTTESLREWTCFEAADAESLVPLVQSWLAE